MNFIQSFHKNEELSHNNRLLNDFMTFLFIKKTKSLLQKSLSYYEM